MNLAIRGIAHNLGEKNDSTFTNDLHPTLQADYILANPPFNDRPWNQEKLSDDARWKYGLPPADNANFAWIQHMIHHLAPEGKIGMVLSDNALSSQRHGESEIRKKIIQDDLIEGIVALPAGLFYGMNKQTKHKPARKRQIIGRIEARVQEGYTGLRKEACE